jgi:hypothetical protein
MRAEVRGPKSEVRDRGRDRDGRGRGRVRSRVRFLAASVLALVAAFTYPSVAARQMPAAPVYAITGVKIVTGNSTIDKGSLVM